jgi:hypothetical protein
MPFVPVPGAAEATIHYTLAGQDVQNTLWFVSETGLVTAEECGTLAEALVAWVNSSLMPQLPEAVTANFIAVRAQDVEFGPGADANLSATAGGIVDDPMPNEVTLAISFRTASTGRGARGRNYIPALPRANVAGNNVDSAYASNFPVIYSALNLAVEATGFIHCVAHRFSGFTIVAGKKVPTPLVTGITFAVTSYILADLVVDAQRRRGPGRGR